MGVFNPVFRLIFSTRPVSVKMLNPTPEYCFKSCKSHVPPLSKIPSPAPYLPKHPVYRYQNKCNPASRKTIMVLQWFDSSLSQVTSSLLTWFIKLHQVCECQT